MANDELYKIAQAYNVIGHATDDEVIASTAEDILEMEKTLDMYGRSAIMTHAIGLMAESDRSVIDLIMMRQKPRGGG